MLHDAFFRVRALFRRSTLEAELDEELRFHFDKQVAKYLNSGMAPAEAICRVRLEFGGLAQVKDEYRDARGVMFVDSLLQDVRSAIRTLRRAPVFTVSAVLTLALGIGANTAIFSVINRVLLDPLPYPSPQELVAARQNDSLQNLKDIQHETRTFAKGGGVNIETLDFTGGGDPVRIHAAFVDSGQFETLAVPPLLGRFISSDEDVKGGPRNVVVSYQFWRNFLSSDPHVLGKSISLSGNSYTIIGVMPSNFTLPKERADVFVSLWVAYPEAAPFRGVHFMHTYWRLKPGTTLPQAQAEISELDRRLADRYPSDERGRQTVLMPLHEWLVGDVRTALLVLFGAVGLVLLIACTNFAMLLVARAVSRQRELMIRASLGAENGRLIRQRLTESIVLALAGGAVGLLFAKVGTALLSTFKPAALLRFSGIRMDARVFWFVFAISLLTGIVFGLVPAWSAARGDIAESLRESTRSMTAGSSRHLLRSFLVTGEFALALVLMAGAGLLIKGFLRLRAIHPGFSPTNILTLYLQLPASRYAQVPRQTSFRRDLLTKLNGLPGIEAAMITDIPLGGNYLSHTVVIEGQPTPAVGAEPEVQTLSVMGSYFRVMQIPIRAGRDFTDLDHEGQPLAAIVNEQFVRRFFPDQHVLGARIDWVRKNEPHRWITIVGVVGDVKHSGLNQPPDPAVYAPFPSRMRHGDDG